MPAHRRGLVAPGSSPARIVAAHVAAILGGGLALSLAPVAPLRAAGGIAAGTSLFALSGLLREASCRRLARHPGLNDALGMLAGWPALLPLAAYRAFEGDHHRATNAPDDPQRPLGRRAALGVGFLLYVVLCHRHAYRTLRGRRLAAYGAETLAMALAWGAVAAGVAALGLGVMAWVPLLVAAAWHNLRVASMHLDRPAGRFADTWQVVLPAPLSRWLLHADHHLEQHLRPEVRWTDLPLVRAEIDRGGFLPADQRLAPGQVARLLLARRADAGAAPRWAGRAAIRARRRQPNHPPRDSVVRLAPE